jgi:hypothetical protein
MFQQLKHKVYTLKSLLHASAYFGNHLRTTLDDGQSGLKLVTGF